jgi:hypothetical protein
MEKINMRFFVLTFELGASLLFLSGQAAAQYQYTDGKGVTKTTQYKLDIPEPYRDAAVWVGPTGIGKPGLSEEARQTKQRDDAYRRIGEASSQLVPYQGSAAPEESGGPDKKRPLGSKSGRYKSTRTDDDLGSNDMATMCIAGEQRVMTSPGHWTVVGSCYSTPSSINSTPVLGPR